MQLFVSFATAAGRRPGIVRAQHAATVDIETVSIRKHTHGSGFSVLPTGKIIKRHVRKHAIKTWPEGIVPVNV